MDLIKELFSIYSSNKLPSHSLLVESLDRCVNVLECEDSSYRPKEKNKKKSSGGLLNFCSQDFDKPVIVVPDLHARGYFLLNVLRSKISLADGNSISIIDGIASNKIILVCVGDIFHSESRCYARWQRAYSDYLKDNIASPEMCEEMKENLNLLMMILKLKTIFPSSFHCLKGNHENILNEEGRGNHPFYKMAAEGDMFYKFLSLEYDDVLIYLLSIFEHLLPVCAVFPNLIVSHAEPAFTMTKSKIINYSQHDEVIYGLTWTENDKAQKSSVSKSIKNLVGKNCRNVVWIGGHRPVHEKYVLRQRGKFIQIHNPNQQNIAVVFPGIKFNPETNIYSVGE